MVIRVLGLKKIMFLLVLSVLANPWGVVALAVKVPRVLWEHDPSWATVLERTRTSEQSILLDFHAPWCGPCKMLDSFVYNEKMVITELASVFTVKYDIDKEANGHLKESFDIRLLPTLIWCDSKGREVGRFTGFLDRDEFLAKMHEFRQAETDFSFVKDKLHHHPENAQLLLRMAELETKRGNLPEAETQYRRLINLRFSSGENEEINQKIAEGMLQLAALKTNSGQDSEAKNMGRMAARLDGSEVAAIAFQESIGDASGVLETYRLMVAKDDMNVEALTGFARACLDQRVELLEGSRMAIRAAVLSDEDPEKVALLSEIFYRRGLYRKSIRWMKKAVAVEPDNQDFMGQLERYETALRNDPYGMKGVPD